MSSWDAIVVGAGMGGLSTALVLASQGARVKVYESAGSAGGKVAVAHHDGVEFDTGPSLLTMPYVLRDLFARAGTRLEDELELVTPELAFRYMYEDGVVLDIHHEMEDTRASVRATLGRRALKEFDRFMRYSQDIWEAARPNFVECKAPNVTGMFALGLTKMGAVRKIDPLRSMWSGITKHVSDPYLQMLFARYATYNGSNPYRAPATLNCIAWVELGLGCYGVRGGMASIPRALARVAQGLGVEIAYDTPVRALEMDGSRVVGVVTQDGEVARAPVVVANADVAHVLTDLLPQGISHGLATQGEASMSGWTAMLRAKRRPGFKRAAHTVLFPTNYAKEFEDIFDSERPPLDPTVYLCSQELSHGRPGWEDATPIFVMANAPCEPVDSVRDPDVFEALEHSVVSRLKSFDLMGPEDALVWRRTPGELAAEFPGSRGSIYGVASNSQFAAFRRPPNRVSRVPGLYLASGSAHPGGGVPMCLLSGRIAAEEALEHELRGVVRVPGHTMR